MLKFDPLHPNTKFERARAQAEAAFAMVRDVGGHEHLFAIEAHDALKRQADRFNGTGSIIGATEVMIMARDLFQALHLGDHDGPAVQDYREFMAPSADAGQGG